MITGFETFSLYTSVKLHFTSKSYDYFKYSGKTKVTVSGFENHKSKYHFYKLSRKYQNIDDLLNFIVANLIEDNNIWVGNLLNEESDIIYRQRQKVIQSLSYIFEEECHKIFDGHEDKNIPLQTKGDYPPLLTMLLRKEVSPESAIILNTFLNFIPSWNNRIADTIRWPNYNLMLGKYTNFVKFDPIKYRDILKKAIY